MQPMFTEFLLQPWPPNPRFCFFFLLRAPGPKSSPSGSRRWSRCSLAKARANCLDWYPGRGYAKSNPFILGNCKTHPVQWRTTLSHAHICTWHFVYSGVSSWVKVLNVHPIKKSQEIHGPTELPHHSPAWLQTLATPVTAWRSGSSFCCSRSLSAMPQGQPILAG